VALMRTVQDITYDVTGQLLTFDCPEGRPSAVTSVDVFRWDVSDDDIAEAASGSGSVETNPNTTIDAASGYGQTDPLVLNVAATTGFEVGRTYLVTSATGQREWFDVSAIASAVSVTARHPLHNAYANADTVQSTRIQATVDATWAADEENITTDVVGPNPMYRVRWVYVVAGVTYVADSYFNLVRYAARHGVTGQDVEVQHPGWLDNLPTDHRIDQGRKLIDNAYREVRIDLHQVDLAASGIAESEIVDELVRYRAVELGEWARFLSNGGDQTRAQAAAQRYQTRLDSLIRIVTRVPVRDKDGGATALASVGLSRR
jgi:hypothetical protein